MNENILTYPRVSLCYARGVNYRVMPEIASGEYGYRLKVGQRLRLLRYRETNYSIYIQPLITAIGAEGLEVEVPGPRGTAARHFVPWVKDLPINWTYAPRELYAVPCGYLCEYKPMAELLAEEIDPEAPMWLERGYPAADPLSAANLRYFERV